MKLYPKCMMTDKGLYQPPALSANGFFYPCCWCDQYMEKFDREFNNLTQEHLRISNVEDIKDIFTSEEWYDFFESLIDDPKNAPSICKEKCGAKESRNKEIVKFKDENQYFNIKGR
jgi:hypothetical protein